MLFVSMGKSWDRMAVLRACAWSCVECRMVDAHICGDSREAGKAAAGLAPVLKDLGNAETGETVAITGDRGTARALTAVVLHFIQRCTNGTPFEAMLILKRSL